MKYLPIVLGGGTGSLTRYVVGTAIMTRLGGRFPLGTLVINVTGSFLIGLLMTLLTERAADSANLRLWGPNQRISVAEALRVNTINGAYNSHEEAIKGSITPGKLADFVVLSDDLLTVDKEKIKDIQIVRTVVGGSTVYQA